MAETAENIVRLACYFGAVGGGAPDYSNPPSDEWRVDRIDQSDPRHPVAYLSRALTDHAVSRTALFETREVHIWGCDISVDETDDDYRVTPLFWGQVTQNSLQIEAEEREYAVARVSKFHFGTPLQGETVYSPDATDVSVVHRDARFNPTIDQRVTPNMAQRVGEYGFPTDHNLWVDPESVRTQSAADVHQLLDAPTIEVTAWSLGLCVETLQRILNADEDFIDNVTIFADPDVPEAPFDNAAAPENITLKRGFYLDECLDVLLPQYGCSWFLELVEDSTPGHALRFIQPQLAYYQRGVGTEQDVKLQAVGSSLDPDNTNTLQAQITFDIGQVINRVVCHGALQEREVTLELVPAWAEYDDALSVDELTRGTEDSLFEDKPEVHRKWVCNEAGDYDGLRTEITARPDLSGVFDGYIPKRRKLSPPLTYRNLASTETDGIRGPIKVEYSLDDGYTWLDVTGETANARFIPLPNEIGIYFNQPAPPELFVDNFEDLRIRVTGTLVGDQALTSTADVPSWHPNQEPVTLLLDVGDRFFDRQRQETGEYASVLTGDHASRDDQSALDTFATTMRDQEAAASVDARITLSGIVTDYGIGDLLTGISGRDISFNRSADEYNPLYVQVVGREFDGNAQTTTLIVQPYDVPRGQA